MAIVGIELRRLFAVLACVIAVCTLVVEGRSLRRHRHSRLDYRDREQAPPMPRDLPRLADNDPEYRDTHVREDAGQGSRVLGYPDGPAIPRFFPDRSSSHENPDERAIDGVVSPDRYGHEHGHDPTTNYELPSLRQRERKETRGYDGESSNELGSARRKRHYKHGKAVNYRRMTEQDERDFLRSERDQEPEPRESYELEVKKAQNSSICNYTVVADTKRNRVPRDLEHVVCNHAGTSCQGAGSYCCIQTYRKIDVSYSDGNREIMKLYVGCVCALQVSAGLRVVESPLPIHD